MNYYEHHIGDYDSATAHLSLIEDGAYGRLLRLYYRTEAPLPADVAQVCRLVRASTKQDRQIVEALLSEFFALGPDGWHNERADEEIARFRDKQSKARRSAEVRWSANRTQCEGNANALPTQSEGNAPRARPQSPDTNNQQEQKQKTAPKGDLLADVDPQVAVDFRALRLKLRAPITTTAVAGLRREAEKAGLTLTAALAMCCERGWRGFKADWAVTTPHARAGPPQQSPGKTVSAFLALDQMANPRTDRNGHDAAPAMVREPDRPRLAAPAVAEPRSHAGK